jgi:hypothetical protein
MVRRHWWPASFPSDALLLCSVERFKEIARKNNPHTPTQRTNLKKFIKSATAAIRDKNFEEEFFNKCFAKCLRIKGDSIRHVLEHVVSYVTLIFDVACLGRFVVSSKGLNCQQNFL